MADDSDEERRGVSIFFTIYSDIVENYILYHEYFKFWDASGRIYLVG